jgi:hypothetical protein
MWKDIKISLYDVFGYFFPGTILLASFGVYFWARFVPEHTSFPIAFGPTEWTLAILASYVAGHICQAIGSSVFPTQSSMDKDYANSKLIPKEITDKVDYELGQTFGIDPSPDKVSAYWKITLCDQALLQRGKTEYREIFEYREGFYKGLSLSFYILTATLLYRMSVPGAQIQIGEETYVLSQEFFIFATLISLFISAVLQKRHKRFAFYRTREAIVGFLTLNKIMDKKEKELEKNQ